MSYYISKTLREPDFENAIEKVTEALKKEGFGVLTEIDITATLKKKLDVDFYNYRILGACNPTMAYEAVKMEPRVGAMLPCNVILRQTQEGVEVCAIDPAASMMAIDNADLKAVAGQVRDLLAQAVEAI